MPEDPTTTSSILIADDQPGFRSALLRTFGHSPVTILEAGSGDEAWDLVLEHRPRVVVLDSVLPGRSALELTREIKSDTALRLTRVIVLNRAGRESHVADALEAGADLYLTRPFPLAALMALIELTLEEEGSSLHFETGSMRSTLAAAEAQTLRAVADLRSSRRQTARLSRQLSEREIQLEELIGHLLVVQEEERRRVAYDIHDGLAQVALAAQQALEFFSARARPQGAQGAALQRALALTQSTVREARRMIAGLRPNELDEAGLAHAIEIEAQGLRDLGCAVTFEGSLGSERLDLTFQAGLFRIAQEALNNIRKHAGATQVWVKLHRSDGQVHVEIRDNGRGFDPLHFRRGAAKGERLGLASMRERARLLAATLILESAPGEGTTIFVDAPVS